MVYPHTKNLMSIIQKFHKTLKDEIIREITTKFRCSKLPFKAFVAKDDGEVYWDIIVDIIVNEKDETTKNILHEIEYQLTEDYCPAGFVIAFMMNVNDLKDLENCVEYTRLK